MYTSSKFAALAAAGCLTALVAGTAVEAAEITVVASGGPLPNVMGTLVSMFERASGHKGSISFKGGPAITDDVKQGAGDLLVTNAGVVDDLSKSGDVAAGGKTLLMISKNGVQQVAELLPVPGIDFVGVLPGDLQKQILYSAGIPAKAKDRVTARALIDFLRSEPVLAV